MATRVLAEAAWQGRLSAVVSRGVVASEVPTDKPLRDIHFEHERAVLIPVQGDRHSGIIPISITKLIRSRLRDESDQRFRFQAGQYEPLIGTVIGMISERFPQGDRPPTGWGRVGWARDAGQQPGQWGSTGKWREPNIAHAKVVHAKD